MVLDSIDNLEKYMLLNSLFPQVIDYLRKTDFNELKANTKIEIQGNDITVSCANIGPKRKEEAQLEAHNEFIDIQIPLTGTEIVGYSPRSSLSAAPYDKEKDIIFFENRVESYFTVKPGMFVIFFPQDGHAPGITEKEMKKIVIKIRV